MPMEGYNSVPCETVMTKTGSLLMAAWIVAFTMPASAGAEGMARFAGRVQPLAGKDCGPTADLAVYVDGRQLTFVATPGPLFRGAIRSDGSFRMLPASEAVVYRQMRAPPVLEGRIEGNSIAGDVTSRWCTYHFSAQRT
jgi:hypothetical protein